MTARDPHGFGALLAELRALDPANDDPELDALLDGLDAAVPGDDASNDNAAPELGALLDGLPAALPHVLAPVVVEEPAALVPEVVTTAPAPVASPCAFSAPVVVPEVVTNAPARTRRKLRRSGLRQRADARDMRAHGRAAGEEAVEHLPLSNSTSSTTTPTAQNDNNDPKTTPKKSGRGRLIASWDDAGDLPRIVAINRGLDRFGVPMAFSVNFDPKLIKAGNDNARGLLDHMRRRIALTLKRTLGETPPMWVAIETDDDSRPHIHGGIALTDRHAPAVVLGGLAKAGGNWTRQGSAPADLRAQHDPDGWATYPFKRAPRTRRDLHEAAGLPLGARVSLYAASVELLAVGKRIHEELRRAIGRR